MSNNLSINFIQRITSEGEVENLDFVMGLNFIKGQHNAGKTVWLKMIDYLLGDASPVEKAFDEDEDLLFKYIALRMSIIVDNEEHIIERKWIEKGLRTKIIFDDDPLSAEDFSNKILTLLGIPNIKIPKGNPYANTWNSLSFRTLFRHLYRQERFWSDIADKQPEADQFAALAQFLGFADKIFSQELTDISDKYKDLAKLESQKEQFDKILDQITRDITSEEEDGMISFVTVNSIDNTINLIEEKIRKLLIDRGLIIKSLVEEKASDKGLILQQGLADRRVQLIKEKSDLQIQLELEIERTREIQDLKIRILSEIEKLGRADASKLISDLKISHCPACDQNIEHLHQYDHTGRCFLCNQVVDAKEEYAERINFEIKQLNIELGEIENLAQQNLSIASSVKQKIDFISSQISDVERKLEPLKDSLSIFTNQELGLIDIERGKLGEKIENLLRIKRNLSEKDRLNKAIDILNKNIQAIEKKVSEKDWDIKYRQIASYFEDSMMSYINEINKEGKNVWKLDRINMYLSDRNVDFYVGNKKWTALSATMKAYFFLAYHYAFLDLSIREEFNLPGLLILDFPLQFGDTDISNNLNYLIEPFQELSKKRNNIQVIIAGKYFDDIPGSNIIELHEIWK